MDEIALPGALAADLDGAFEHVLILYGERIYRFALRSTGRPEDAEEAAQDTFIRAYRALSGYDAERVQTLAIRPWLYRIALNVLRNRARRHAVELVPLAHDPAGEEGMPEGAILRMERRTETAALLARLPERYRAAVVLRYVEGLGYREMADVLEQPIGTVKSNVHRGIETLRVMMRERMMA